MNNKKTGFIEGIVSEFKWYNEPAEYKYNNGLVIKTSPYTDFWQKTHYRFQKDNGHCYLTEKTGDFSLIASFEFTYKVLYDQCGLFLKIDQYNWVKTSIEYEDKEVSKLGSVVANFGYSDWATTDISTGVKAMCYRINKNGNDILLENSHDGINWKQMRISHLHKDSEKVQVGIYACSPKDSSFECKVTKVIIGENKWKHEE